MVENTAMSLHNVNTEIDRYIIWPGQVCLNAISVCSLRDLHCISSMLTFIVLQACAYKVGEIKIKELRKKAEQKLGMSGQL